MQYAQWVFLQSGCMHIFSVRSCKLLSYCSFDIARFLKAIEGNLYELLYIVTLFAGLRQGEVLGLTWDCVDFEANTLYINKQLQKENVPADPIALCLLKTIAVES